jgi:heat shock protein HslJ
MKHSKIILSFAVMAFLFSGCAAVTNTLKNSVQLFGTPWKLIQINGNQAVIPAGADVATLALSAADASFGGTGSCNSFYGNYVINGTQLSFKNLGSTKMACDNMNLEIDYFHALNTVDSYKIVDKTLYLYSGNKAVLVFEAYVKY